MPKEYIEREAVDAAIKAAADHRKAIGVPGEQAGFLQAHDIVRSFPAADVVERKSARWKGAGHGDYYCSLCNETYGIGAERVKNWHFCPNCGADMRNGGPNE